MKRFLKAFFVIASIVLIFVLLYFALLINDKPVAPTCTETGLGDGQHLSIVSLTLKEQEVIPALGHDMVHYNAKAATCTEPGYDAYDACERCGYSTCIEIPPLGHNFSSGYFCKRCNLDYASYCIGENLTTLKVSNDNVGYDFYTSQRNTGTYSSMNCGPTCVYMACKWYDESFSASVEEIRDLNVKPLTSDYGWSPDTIKSTLKHYSIDSYYYHIESLSNSYYSDPISDLVKYIDRGDLLIICFKTKDIEDDPNCNTIFGNAYWGGDYGHFVLIKGYWIVDGKLFFEIYDPNLPRNYKSPIDGVGNTRYYDAVELSNSAHDWCEAVVVVPHNTSK